MKVLIVYFSQTGNTKKIAECIHKGILDNGDECDLVEVRDVDVRKIREYDLVGVGGPAIGAEADIIKRFVFSVPLTSGQHAFLFNTHGALPRRYFPEAIRRMQEREFTVIGWKGFYASVHIQCFPSPYYTDGHPDAQDLADAEAFGKEMAERSKRVYQGEAELIPPIPDLELPKPFKLPHGGVEEQRGIHGDRRYDPSKCRYPQCHLCIDNCPEHFIDFSKEPREYGNKLNMCTTNECCYCELICPFGAIYIEEDDIQYGLDFLKEHHDFFEKTLNEEEAAGDFRRLVPEDQVGWDTPYCDVYAQRPRMKATRIMNKKKEDNE